MLADSVCTSERSCCCCRRSGANHNGVLEAGYQARARKRACHCPGYLRNFRAIGFFHEICSCFRGISTDNIRHGITDKPRSAVKFLSASRSSRNRDSHTPLYGYCIKQQLQRTFEIGSRWCRRARHHTHRPGGVQNIEPYVLYRVHFLLDHYYDHNIGHTCRRGSDRAHKLGFDAVVTSSLPNTIEP